MPASAMIVERALLYEDDMLPGRPLRMFSPHDGEKTDEWRENLPADERQNLVIRLLGSFRRDYSLPAENRH